MSLIDFFHSELYPGKQVQTDAEIRKAMLSGVSTLQPPCSTIPMGKEGTANVVVDVIMTAEKIADQIKGLG